MINTREEIEELLGKLDWCSHEFYSQKHINKIRYLLQDGKMSRIKDIDVRILKRLLKKQNK